MGEEGSGKIKHHEAGPCPGKMAAPADAHPGQCRRDLGRVLARQIKPTFLLGGTADPQSLRDWLVRGPRPSR